MGVGVGVGWGVGGTKRAISETMQRCPPYRGHSNNGHALPQRLEVGLVTGAYDRSPEGWNVSLISVTPVHVVQGLLDLKDTHRPRALR